MIDTIILRIHNLNKYGNLIKNFKQSILPKHVRGVRRESIVATTREVQKLKRLGFNTGEEIFQALIINHSGTHLVKTETGKHRNASNHYEISYFIDVTRDFMELNFSIPKYNFGSNVLMFVDHMGDKEYSFPTCSEFNHNIDRSFDMLQNFLNTFFKMEFAGSEVDYEDVEVHRIDVCFNQIFNSKKDALKYLAYQKRQKKKYARDEEGTIQEWGTTLMYKSQRYSAKIYHKGTEYAKNDRKEHERINKEKKRQYFKTEDYQNLGDRMLRYELTIRNRMLNDLHKSTLFRQKCPYFQTAHKIFRDVENSNQKNDRIAKKAGTLPAELKQAYLTEHPYDKISAPSRRLHKEIQKLITKRTYFKLAVDEKTRSYNKDTSDLQSDDALFSRGLLTLCMYKLVEFIQEYQIKELPPDSKIENLIDQYNLRHRKHLPKREMCAVYRELSRIGSFKDLAKFNQMSRASMFRYKSRFRKIGITENNLIPLTEDGIPQAPLDLVSYHGAMTYNLHFLDKRNFIGLL